jgi:flagella basal body P-ring formation protein FlgA
LLTAPSAVKKGERVTITAALSSINIKMSGKALSNGSIGEMIKVKNISSNKTIEAQVIRPGIVQVRM